MIDIPTAAVPRTMHLFLLPLAACACLLVRDEPPLLRHGIPAACLASFVAAGRHRPARAQRIRAARLDPLGGHVGRHRVRDDDAVRRVLVILAEVAERNGIELELRNALIRGELLLHYQPQVDARADA